MFRKESEFEAFERIMVEVHLRQPIRILLHCVLSVRNPLSAGLVD